MIGKLTSIIRPFVYGLAIGGKQGAKEVIRGLLAVSCCSFPISIDLGMCMLVYENVGPRPELATGWYVYDR